MNDTKGTIRTAFTATLLGKNPDAVTGCFEHDFRDDETVISFGSSLGILDSVGHDLCLSLKHRIPALDAEPSHDTFGQRVFWPSIRDRDPGELRFAVLFLGYRVRVDILMAADEFLFGLGPGIAERVEWQHCCELGWAGINHEEELRTLFTGKLGLTI